MDLLDIFNAIFFCLTVILYSMKIANADQRELYNTKLATSDLQWETYQNENDGGWEEVSSFDETYQNTIRSYQICGQSLQSTGNWIRSPYIPAFEGKQIHLEVEYSIARCDSNSDDDSDSSQCKETFNIFYYGANEDVASSTFPPWHEDPYIKIDTVAANDDKVNKKMFTFETLGRSGFYIAVQDQGACIALIALRAFYYFCPETVKNFVAYPLTISEVGSASLVTVKGNCVPNALQVGMAEPHYRCSSNGQWQIPTGSCVCDAGYEMSSNAITCIACKSGTYKLNSSAESCSSCPANSGVPQGPTLGPSDETASHNQCPCFNGYGRAENEDISTGCSSPPSKPLLLQLVKFNSTSAMLHWQKPQDTGGRPDIFYTFKCQTSVVHSKSWSRCSENILYVAPSSDGKFLDTQVQLFKLRPYREYRITVVAENGASFSLRNRDVANSSAITEFTTQESAPSMVGKIHSTDRSFDWIALTWSKPLHPNGKLLAYEVEYHLKETSLTTQTPKIQKTPSTKITLQGLEEDTEYQFRVRAQTSAGYGPYSDLYKVKTLSITLREPSSEEPSPEDNNVIYIIAGAVGGVLLLFALFVVIRFKRSRKLLCLDLSKKGRKTQHPPPQNGNATHEPLLPQEQLIVDLPPLGQRTYVDYADPARAIIHLGREIDPTIIKIEEVIGQGEFAEVCRGKIYLHDQFLDVAVKRLKSGATSKDQMNFLKEASTMAQFSHPNIIELKGVVTKSVPAIIVTEFMENGSLDQFLQTNKGKLSVLQLVKMLHGIVNGMNYLSQMNYIHRDLAARNILVDSDLVCKICDFGLSRTLENDPHATYTTQGGKIAIRWTAPESILYRKFTSSSDVWSFGILAWEVMSYGEKPYWDMQNDDVIKNIQQGMRLPSPVDCPKILHKMMLRCWSADSNLRPEFSDLAREFDILKRQPSYLFTDGGHSQVFTVNEKASAAATSTASLGRAVDSGEVDSVDKWLEIQRLSNYSEHFKQKGIDNLEKVSNLTLNDLQALGIEVKLHISTLESGIRTLKRHLSTCTSTPSSSRPSSSSTTVLESDDQGLVMKSQTPDEKRD